MLTARRVRRALAIAGVVAAGIAVAALVLGRGGGYTVHAVFQNASQIVAGDQVRVGGVPAGSVTDLKLTSDGQAELTLEVDGTYVPVRRGTVATVRATGLAGIANRYVDLRLAPATNARIPDGGTIPAANTRSAVDLDEVLSTFDSPTRNALRGVVRGSAELYSGRSRAANLGWLYLDPAVSTSTRLLGELDRDTPLLERFVVANSNLATDLASRESDLTALVGRLATATGAVAARKRDLADALRTLPPFMREANTTFVNLRAALDDLKPLVDTSKPVARKLRPYLAALRSFATGARPTLRDLAAIVRSPGTANDLVELTASSVPVRRVAVGPVRVGGTVREGALPASARALRAATPLLAFARPYAVDLTGWFDDFSHTGIFDALGGISRAGFHTSAFAMQSGVLQPVPPALRAALFDAVATLHQNDRCPGSVERSTPDSPLPYRPSPNFHCDPSQRPVGP